MSFGYEFADKNKPVRTINDLDRVRTIVIKIKKEVYSIKISPVQASNIEIVVPIEITNSNIHKQYVISATPEHNQNDTAECLMEIFKKQVIESLKNFIEEKRKKIVIDKFNSMLDDFSLDENDVAVEEL
jgi:hypothetical protein